MISYGKTTRRRSTLAELSVLAALLVLTTMFLLPDTVGAQDVAVASATATVLATVTVSASANLAFGDVFQGVPTTVANNASSAAVFDITGQTDAGINLHLILPEYLTLSDNSDRMNIVFRSTDASVDTTGASDPTSMAAGDGWQNTNPHVLPAAIIGSGGTSVYLGGSVQPAVNQKSGTYSGDIVLTVTYNGS